MKELGQNIRDKAQQISCVITDVDGVMTDGSIIFDNAGMEYKQFNVKDGQVIQHLKASKIIIGVITGRDSQVVRNRCSELSMDFHFHGVKEKGITLAQVLKKYRLRLSQVAYIGDDINDLPIEYNIAWYEQKAVIVLLALLYLGVKDIHLGPTLPAFLSPNVANVLVEKFGISGIGEPKEDVEMFMKK